MYEGGHSKEPRSAKVFHIAGLFVPAFLIIYGLLIQSGLVSSPHFIDSSSFLMFAFWWAAISIIQYLSPISSKLDSGLRLVAFHLLAGSYLIFISGVASPIAIFWLLLALGSYIYFSVSGLLYSILTMAVFVSFDMVLWTNINKSIAIYDLITLSIIAITSYILYNVSKSSEISQKELAISKAQESLQRDRVITIVNNLADAVISTDMEGVIKVYNAACLNLLDTNVTLNGKHIDDILPLIDTDNKDYSLFKELQNARTVGKRDDLYFVVSDDEKMRLEVTYSPIKSSYSRSKKAETHDGYIVIMRDITKAKSLEEERDEFISVISHELRTPITIVEGTISNAQVMMDHPDVTKKMLKDSMETAHEQILFLAGMVNDLSTLSRAERGVGDNAEDIDVHELATELHKKYQADAKSKNLHLNLDSSTKLGKVHVSRLYLEELLQNFITNSIKYTKQGSVTIQIKQKNDVISFTVKDTGIGISKSDQQKVFAKFYRSEDYRTRETSGTGLGLYVSSKLAHKMGTKIHLISRLNFGSSFSFNLPVVK